MKKGFWNLFVEDFNKEGFTMKQFVVGNVLAITAMFLLMALCGWLESVLV